MFNFFIIAVVIAFLYMYVPHFQKLSPTEYSVPLPIRFEGPMTVNNRLSHVERLFENEIHWPESMAVHEGKIYTGLGDGSVVRLNEDSVREICKTGSKCEGQHEENICGRPLGMNFDSKGKLYLVDAYHGLFVIDVKTGNKKQLVPSSTYIEGKQLIFLNDFAIDEDEQVLYISQSSTKWNISMVITSIFEHDTSGRLLKYDLRKNIISVVARDLAFPNGVELTHDKKSILVAETNNFRILKFDIRGSKKMEILPLLLPGEPDNISRNPRGNYWVGISAARTADSPNFYDRMSRYPTLRKTALVLYHTVAWPVSFILKMVPMKEVKEKAFELLSMRMCTTLTKAHGIILEFDDKGNVLQSLHAPNGEIAHISEVLEKDGHLYLGSWRNRYLGKVKL